MNLFSRTLSSCRPMNQMRWPPWSFSRNIICPTAWTGRIARLRRQRSGSGWKSTLRTSNTLPRSRACAPYGRTDVLITVRLEGRALSWLGGDKCRREKNDRNADTQIHLLTHHHPVIRDFPNSLAWLRRREQSEHCTASRTIRILALPPVCVLAVAARGFPNTFTLRQSVFLGRQDSADNPKTDCRRFQQMDRVPLAGVDGYW